MTAENRDGSMNIDKLKGLFPKGLSGVQKLNIDLILNEAQGLSQRHRAYILATTYHETAGSMTPIKETVMPHHKDKNPTDETVKARLTKAWKSGKLPWVKSNYWSGGYFGRGFVQLTHLDNYRKMSSIVGADLVDNPNLALNPTVAAEILVQGMVRGMFTGKNLSDYTDFVQMRRIVNGTDKADLIAAHAMKFYEALEGEAEAKPATLTPAKATAVAAVTAATLGIGSAAGLDVNWTDAATVAIAIVALVLGYLIIIKVTK